MECYTFFHVQELNTLVITGDDDEVKNAEVEEEPELPIGVSIKGLRKVFKASINFYDIQMDMLRLYLYMKNINSVVSFIGVYSMAKRNVKSYTCTFDMSLLMCVYIRKFLEILSHTSNLPLMSKAHVFLFSSA